MCDIVLVMGDTEKSKILCYLHEYYNADKDVLKEGKPFQTIT
jgi:hypothetical protein